MSDCSSLPTLQDFEDSLKYMDSNKEFIESQNDTLVTPNGQPKYTITGAVNKLEQEALSRSRVSAPQNFVNLQFFYTFTGFNASLSSYYVYSDDASIPTQLLIPDVHYEFTDTTTTTIQLKDSYIGGKIIAKSLDPTGSGVISAGNSFATVNDLKTSVGLEDNSTAYVTDNTQSRYTIINSISVPGVVGDILMNDGRVAVLQPTSNGYDVHAFGDSSSTSAHQSMFENASERAYLEARKASLSERFGNVYVPARMGGGSWNLTQAITQAAVWTIGIGSEQANPPNYSNNNLDNLSYLTGRVVKVNGRGDSLQQIGATDIQWVQDIDNLGRILGTSMHTSISDSGKPCYTGAVRTSDNPVATEGSMVYKAYALNDRITNPGVVYCGYSEAIQVDGAGTTMCHETNVIPNSTRYSIYPNQNIGNSIGATFNHLFGGPVNRPAFPNTSSTSCANLYSGGSAINPANNELWGFESIWVVLHNSMRNSLLREVMRLPTDTSIAYYSELGALRCRAKGSLDSSSNGQYAITVYSASNQERSYIATGSDWRPGNDAVQSIGAPAARNLDGFFVNTPTGTSDRNEKQQETKITEALHEAALAVEPLLWKWNAAVKDKGSKARWHAGPIAQDVQDVFESRGINPFEYGFIGKDAITKTVPNGSEMQKDSEGKLVEVQLTKEIPTGASIMNIRATELQWLIISAQNARQNKLEERLNALENK